MARAQIGLGGNREALIPSFEGPREDSRVKNSSSAYKSETRDGMRIDWDVPIPMDDGVTLRADVFRPVQAAIRIDCTV